MPSNSPVLPPEIQDAMPRIPKKANLAVEVLADTT